MSSSTSVAVTLALAPAARLIAARVNVWRRQPSYEITINEEGVNPAIAAPLLRELRGVLARLAEVRIPGVTPAVGVHLERDMHPATVTSAVGPHLVSVYLGADAMPRATADDLAAALEWIIGDT